MSDSIPFTQDFLDWIPWMPRATDTDLPAERIEEIRAFIGTGSGTDYVNVLANDFGSLKARALVHRHVYSSTEPLPTAWRELGATTASRINGCVFCASVHARLYSRNIGNQETVQRLLDEGFGAELPPIERAIVDLATKLTLQPEALDRSDLRPLRDLGLDEVTILDVINYTAFFANANRLMLTLGEPRRQQK